MGIACLLNVEIVEIIDWETHFVKIDLSLLI